MSVKSVVSAIVLSAIAISVVSQVPEIDQAAVYFRTVVGNVGDVRWHNLLAPVPFGVAIMSQLMISASRVTDIKIDQKPGPLMRHPESFRTSLVQIGNDAYVAFSKAHSNMEQIRLEMVQVPTHVQETVKILRSGNKAALENFLPGRLTRIQEAADEGFKLSNETAESFNQLTALISQVLEATSASLGAKEQKIEADIKAAIEEDKRRQLEMKEMEKKHLDVENQLAREAIQNSQESVNEAIKQSSQWEFGIWRFVEMIFYRKERAKSVETAREFYRENEKRLDAAKKELKKVEEEMKKITEEYTNKLKNMHIDVKKEIDREQAIDLLRDGLKNLGELQKHWAGMTQYFQSIRNIIKTTTEKKIIDFKKEAAVAADDSSALTLMADSIMQASQSSYMTHRIADMYVKVSVRYIMNNVAAIQAMNALKDKDVQEAQDKLLIACQESSDGILKMVTEENKQIMQLMEQVKEEDNEFNKNEL